MSDAGSDDFTDAAGPELEPQPAPWWQEVCEAIARGETVDAVRAGLAVQQQAQHYATRERIASENSVSESCFSIPKLLPRDLFLIGLCSTYRCKFKFACTS